MAGNFGKKEHAFRTFNADIKEGNFPPVMFMYGPEEYLTEWAAGSLLKRYVHPA